MPLSPALSPLVPRGERGKTHRRAQPGSATNAIHLPQSKLVPDQQRWLVGVVSPLVLFEARGSWPTGRESGQ